MNYEIMAFLFIAAYIAVGIFINAIIISIDNCNDIPYGLIIFLWPILVVLAAILFVVVIVPAALGECMGNFIKKKTKK